MENMFWWSKEIYCDKKSIAKTKGKIVLFV